MSTIFHSNYYAHELTRRFSSEKFEKLSQSLFNATVDMNPHQIEAALFAFRSPLSRGAILADEIGLEKPLRLLSLSNSGLKGNAEFLSSCQLHYGSSGTVS